MSNTHTALTANAPFQLLYVASPLESASFYESILGSKPVETSPTFVMFALGGGVMLGLWSKDTVIPASTPVGGSELAFRVSTREDVDVTAAKWRTMGMPIVQAPSDVDFGYTFTATDPDGHRLRVFAPGH